MYISWQLVSQKQDLRRQLSEEQSLVRKLQQELLEAEALNSTLRNKTDDTELRESMAEAKHWATVAKDLKEELQDIQGFTST
eukprot:s1473_g21.t1